MIAVFLVQGLLGSVLAAPVVKHSAAHVEGAAASVVGTSVMVDCHGQEDKSPLDISAPQTKASTDTERCAGVCCCPGMCGAASVLASELPILAERPAPSYQSIQPVAAISRPSKLYRPPSLI